MCLLNAMIAVTVKLVLSVSSDFALYHVTPPLEGVQNAFNTVLPTFVSRLFVSMIMIAALAIHAKSMLKIPDKIGV